MDLGKLIGILVVLWIVGFAFLISIGASNPKDICKGMMFFPVQDVPAFCLVDSAKEIISK